MSSGKPWTDKLSVNKADPSATGTPLAVTPSGEIGRLLDDTALPGYVQTLIDPLTGEAGWAANSPTPPVEPPATSGTVRVKDGGVDSLLVDAGANAGDVVTLINALTGEVGFAAPTGGTVFEQDFPATAIPAIGAAPVFLAVAHNLNAYPKNIQVYALLASGEPRWINEYFIGGGGLDSFGWTVSASAGVPTPTVNTYNVGLYNTNDVDIEGQSPLTIRVRLTF